MKKLTTLLAVFAVVASNAAHAAPTPPAKTGTASQQGTYSSGTAWGIGLGGLALVGAVVGATVAGATSTSGGSSFSH